MSFFTRVLWLYYNLMMSYNIYSTQTTFLVNVSNLDATTHLQGIFKLIVGAPILSPNTNSQNFLQVNFNSVIIKLYLDGNLLTHLVVSQIMFDCTLQDMTCSSALADYPKSPTKQHVILLSFQFWGHLWYFFSLKFIHIFHFKEDMHFFLIFYS